MLADIILDMTETDSISTLYIRFKLLQSDALRKCVIQGCIELFESYSKTNGKRQ